MKKLGCLVLALVLCLCALPALAEGDGYTVGICQLVKHPALDAATQGFIDALTEKLGDSVAFETKIAAGEKSTCITIVNDFIAADVDLILANATDALQAAATGTGEIPILGTSITDYASALDIDDWAGVTGMNVSGTSDLAPLDEQAAMIAELFPEAREVGILYCSAEANSLYQVQVVTEELTAMGLNATAYAFTDSNDVASVTEAACAASDVLYIPTDNTAASCTEAIRNVVEVAGMPVIAGEEGICSGCGVATLSISYYELGYATGEMAWEVLANGADVSEMPIRYAPNVTRKYNAEMAGLLGVEIPEGYVAIGE